MIGLFSTGTEFQLFFLSEGIQCARLDSFTDTSIFFWLKPFPLENADEVTPPAVVVEPMGETTAGERGKWTHGVSLVVAVPSRA